MTGKKPFFGYDDHLIISLYRRMMRPRIRRNTNNIRKMIEIIKCCWSEDATDRPTATAIIKWLKPAQLGSPMKGHLDALSSVYSVEEP
jgi:hypothetical protein